MAGGTSQTGNAKVRGIIANPAANAAGTIVYFTPHAYSPLSAQAQVAFTDTTDSAGAYCFTNVPADSYSLEAQNPVSGRRLLKSEFALKGSDSLFLGTDSLLPWGAACVRIPPSFDSLRTYIFVPGTHLSQRIHRASSTAAFAIVDSLPAGTIALLAYGQSGSDLRQVLVEQALITPGDTSTFFAGITYHVATTGSDDNDGLLAPLLSIRKACRLLNAGDTLLIAAGVYRGEHDLQVFSSGAPHAAIVIRGPQSGGAVLNADADATLGAPTALTAFSVSNTARLELRNMSFVNYNLACRITSSSRITIDGCGFSGFSAGAIQSWESDHCTVSNCQFVNPAGPDSAADTSSALVFYATQQGAVEECYFFGGGRTACLFKRQNQDCIIAHCTIEGAFTCGIYLGSAETDEDQSRGLTVNNTIVRLAGKGAAQSALTIDRAAAVVCRDNYLETGPGPAGALSDSNTCIKIGPQARGTIEIFNDYLIGGGHAAGLLLDAPAARFIPVSNNTIYNCRIDFTEERNGPYGYANNLSVLSGGIDRGPSNFRGDPGFNIPPAVPAIPATALYKSTDAYFAELTAFFALGQGSPCVDAGIDVGHGYMGKAPDIGAQELK